MSMFLRKVNAILSLICTILLLDHAIFIAAWMLSRGSIPKSADFMPWVLTGSMVIHVFISIDLAISAHMGTEKCKCKNYPKMNAATIVQRISGVLMIIFTGLHIAGATGVMQPPQIVHAIVPALFFTISLAHAAISTSKAFITLGIGNGKTAKAIDIIIKVICGATLIADIAGFYLFVC